MASVTHRVKGRFARAPPTKTVATAAVARLPDEVLSLIFVRVISTADRELTTGLHNVRLSFVINIRRPLCGVCRHWRRVALATPQLWTTILLSHLDDITTEMLTFSKELPLRVIAPASQVSRADSVMAPASARVRELDVVLDAQVLSYPSQSDDIASFNLGNQSFNFFAPAVLQTLRIHAIDLAIGPLSQCLPWASMSSLSFLEFSEALPQEKLPKLASLRTLNINFRGSSSRSLPVSWLLRSLVNIPNVEDVEVFIVSSDKEDPSTLPLRISLPRLKTIRVFAHDLDGSKLFERIDMPSTTCVETRYHRHLPTFDPWVIPVSLNKLFTKYAKHPSPSMERLVISVMGGVPVNLSLILDCHVGPESQAPLLRLDSPMCRNYYTHYMALIMVLPLARLRNLTLHLVGVKLGLWQVLLPACHNILSLSINDAGLALLHSAVLSRKNRGRPCLPSLLTITLSCVDFESEFQDNDKGGTKNHNYKMLVAILRERQRRGVGLKSVRLRGCQISGVMLGVLELFTSVTLGSLEGGLDD